MLYLVLFYGEITMQEKELKLLFHNGSLKSCTVTNALMSDGYMLVFDKKGGKEQEIAEKRPRLAKDKAADNTKIFKSIDGAVIFAHSIGFRKIMVNVDVVISQKK